MNKIDFHHICRSGTRCHNTRKCKASGEYMLQGLFTVDVWLSWNVTPNLRQGSSVWQALHSGTVFINHEALSDQMVRHSSLFGYGWSTEDQIL